MAVMTKLVGLKNFGLWSKISLLVLIGGIILVLKYAFLINKSATKETNNSASCLNCNILLIDVDILRSDSLPCYGYFRNTAPNICQLALKSILFENNFAPNTYTLPSAVSTVTSLQANFHKLGAGTANKLSPEIPTLAETLKNSGYQTVLVGDLNGFAFLADENGGARGYDLITDQPIEEVIQNLKKNPKPWFVHYYLAGLHMPYLLPEGVVPLEKLAAPVKLPITKIDYDQLLNKYLRKNYLAVFQKQAILEFRNFFTTPEEPNEIKLTELFKNLYFKQPNPEKYLKDFWKPQSLAYLESFNQKNPAEVAFVKMLYDTNITLIDQQLGELFKLIEISPNSKKTIKIIMSDHGEAFGEHDIFGHEADFHSILFKTPLIIYSPYLMATRISATSSNLDIFPTILELVGLNKISQLQGKSLIKDIYNQKLNQKVSDRFILSQASYLGTVLQNRDWLYFLPEGSNDINQSKLFNKSSDPKEVNNLAKNYPELCLSLYNQAKIYQSYQAVDFSQNPINNKLPSQIFSLKKLDQMKKEGYF